MKQLPHHQRTFNFLGLHVLLVFARFITSFRGFMVKPKGGERKGGDRVSRDASPNQMMGPRSCSSMLIYGHRCALVCTLSLLLGCSDCSGGKQRWLERAPARLQKKHALPGGLRKDSMTEITGGFLDFTHPKSGGSSQRSWMEELSRRAMILKQGTVGKLPPSEPLLFQSKSANPHGVGRASLRPKKDAPPATRDANILLSCKSVWETEYPWTLESWVRENNCRRWYGVTCDHTTGAVISLNLSITRQKRRVSGPVVSGPLPSQIGGLKSLRALDLGYNALTGSLPSQWSALGNLAVLDLEANSLTGPLPSQWSALRNLTWLDLEENSLTGSLPSEWSALRTLRRLDLGLNLISGSIPAQWSSLSNLQHLELYWNRLSGSLPSQWSALRNLTWLIFQASGLSGSIPSQWSALFNLQYLNLWENAFTGSLPSEWSALRNLTWLGLGLNSLSGSIPAQWSALSNLQHLVVSRNALNGSLPSQWSALRNLTWLELDEIDLTGSLPSEWSALRNLKWLVLQRNAFTGSLPSEWSALRNLRTLDVSENRLSGSISSQWSALLNLEYLDLSFNALNGSLPSQWSTLRKLTGLSLELNSFTGSLPSQWSTLRSLRKINIFGSRLSGSIPPQWSALLNLKFLDLGYNALTGSLPSQWSALRHLTWLTLPRNALTGTLPSQWSTLTKLTRLNLRTNSLSGSIPPQWSALLNLQYLTLHSNQLAGVIPQFNNRSFHGEFNSNYFTGLNESSEPSCRFPRSSINNNCLFKNNKCSVEQRTPSVCQAFCNATSPVGTCGGRGTCAVAGANRLPTCTCDQGFVTDPLNLGNCIPRKNATSPPPPPPRGNRTLGLSFQALAPRRFLNRYSRYISFGFDVSNTVPLWDIKSAVPWMAPASLFASAGVGRPSQDGFLKWTFVRDQGGCSSCWAEAAADSVASSLVIARSSSGGLVPRLSVPQIRTCTNNSGGCEGDLPTNALDYIVQNGLRDADAYNWTGTCPAREQARGGFPQVLFYEAVQFRGWMGLLLTVQNQPAIITLEGSSRAFQQAPCAIQGFILSDPSCYSGSLDHSVLVVGYDLFGFYPYWVIRNSWGDQWCTQGYMRLGIQGGDGTCGMNVLPAYYPVPAPRAGDPCFLFATIPDTLSENNRRPVMNPCGGGTCKPATNIDPYSYTCTCPDGFVAANNSVDLAFPTSKTQSCIPVDACGLSLSNPCKVGTCVNNGLGGYSCICPLGYISGLFVDGNPTCVFVSSTIPKAASYTVEPGVTCALIATTYNLTLSKLQQQNPGLNCALLQSGQRVNVSNPSYQCAVGYIATADDRSCMSLLNNAVGDKGISLEDLEKLNNALDCSDIQKGQLVCLKGGSWPEDFVCTLFEKLGAGSPPATCLTIAQKYFPENPADFFGLNPGIDCQAIIYNLKSARNPFGESVCVGSKPVGAGNCKTLRPPGFLYSLRGGENCDTLIRRRQGGFSKPGEIERYNKGAFKINCNDVHLATRMCTKTRLG